LNKARNEAKTGWEMIAANTLSDLTHCVTFEKILKTTVLTLASVYMQQF